MNLKIHQRLVSKILHDIIAPASSVMNGIELIESTQSMDPEILGFMKEGAQTLNEKLKMFRLTFGATGDPSITNLVGFAQKTASYLVVSGGTYAPITDDQMALTPEEVRILGGMMVLISHIATGSYVVQLSSTTTSLRIAIKGLRFTLKPEQIAFLDGSASANVDDVDVHFAQAWLVRVCADACGLVPVVEANESENIVVTFNKV